MMGLIGNLLGKKDTSAGAKKSETEPPAMAEEGKYNEPCSLCGAAGTEKKWAGKHWHKKCIRRMKHAAKGML